MSKYVCVNCGLAMHPEENGFRATEMMDKEKTKPYKVWDTDKWKCPQCGIEILAGFGQNPLSEHYRDDFEELTESAQLKFY